MNSAPLCIIPARGGSKRFPRKNVALLDGRPLVAWTIAAARESGVFDTVWVSSEDEAILQIAEEHGGTPLPRPSTLAGDQVTVAELCRATAESFAASGRTFPAVYVLLPTSPFRRGETIARAWRTFIDADADALMSVRPLPHPPEWALAREGDWIRPVDESAYETPRPMLTPKFTCDGGHSIVRTEVLRRTGRFLVERTLAFEAPEDEWVDIDEPRDLAWAEFLLAKRKQPEGVVR